MPAKSLPRTRGSRSASANDRWVHALKEIIARAAVELLRLLIQFLTETFPPKAQPAAPGKPDGKSHEPGPG